jgi:hypothetical protein
MIFVWIFAVVAVLALAALPVHARLRRVRKPQELRGDWWPEFEREFRQYAVSQSRRRRQAH